MKKGIIGLLAILLALFLAVSACTPTAQEPAVPAEEESVEVAEEPIVEEAEEADTSEVTSLVGGTITIASPSEPDTLDPHQSVLGLGIQPYIYSSLTYKGENGEYLPYLASSWEISEDGLTITYHLKQDVVFHNGEPLTAQDVAFTLMRAIDPEIGAAYAAADLSALESATALDDYTVELKAKAPNYYLFDFLSFDQVESILSQNAVEEGGESYGRNPVGTGPFVFKEWMTGDHITLERNPDFTWGPMGDLPANIQTVVFRFIAEPATILAGLEAGEIDYAPAGMFQPVDIINLEETGDFDIVSYFSAGLYPFISLNTSQPPFEDVRVRQALNYATDKQALADVVAPNSGSVMQNGPLSPSTEGYWPGIEDMGYAFDLEKARQLMLDSGYSYNADNMLEKDGATLSVEMITVSGYDVTIKSAQVIQSQWKELGIDVSLTQLDLGVAYDTLISGNYAAAAFGWGWLNSELMNQLFASRNIGSQNFGQVNDPELDALLDQMTTATSVEAHLQAAKDAQIRIVEQAYVIPLFSQRLSSVVSKRIVGYSDDYKNQFRIWNAYINE